MTTLRGSIRRVIAGHGAAVILVLSLIGLVVFGVLSGPFDAARMAQIAATLVAPAMVMTVFWLSARKRLRRRQSEFEATLQLEGVTAKATGKFLAGVSHELTPHPETCKLRAEALAVAVDYQSLGAEIKVAVADLAVETDPHILRQILHVLVGNAIRHGGRRVAIWASVEGESVRVTVSDDGPGLAQETGEHVFERLVDLAEQARPSTPGGSGLAVARALGELLDGEMGYKRDPSWTHFSISLAYDEAGETPPVARVPLQAGVR